MRSDLRILFIADEVPQSINAGSIQFFRILKDYPDENLLVLGKAPTKNAQLLKCRYVTLKFKFLERLRLSRFTSVLSDLQSLGFFLPKLNLAHQKLADDFNPDLVVTLMQHITYYYPAYHYAKSRKKPLTIYCHDDAEDFSRIHPFFKAKLVGLNATIYKYASKRICISPEMAIAWAEKYGANGEFMYPVSSGDISARPIEASENLVDETGLTVGYAGSLAYGYKEGIMELLPIFEKNNVKIRIYRNPDDAIPFSKYLLWAGFSNTAEETWERIKKECDAVILPYSNKLEFRSLYTTHFPSKLTEYVELGMPIIINGPEYSTGVKWGVKNNDAVAVSNSCSIENVLKYLLDPSFRVNLVAKGTQIRDFKTKRDV